MLIGITRIRNESKIINYTLDHVSKLVDMVFVIDDCSTDKTVKICKKHPIVEKVLVNKKWAKDPKGRNLAEGNLRTKIYKEALKKNPDWIYCFDADEFADFDGIDFKADAYRLRLFDFYITKEDVNKHFLERKYMGREYRDILMLFKPNKNIRFYQREPRIPETYKIENAGYVKHYGKAISIKNWEKTCDYYIHNRGGDFLPIFTDRWRKRKGKAIHNKSDFGNELITWEERKKGFLLTI